MVLTVPVRTGRAHPRRSFLGATGTVAGAVAAAALTGTGGLLAGCSLPDVFGGEPDPRPLPDAEALRAVAADSLLLAARHEAAIGQVPDQATRLTALRDAHREHAAAIGRSLGESPGPSLVAGSPSESGAPPGSGAAAVLRALATAERGAAERAAIACVQVESFHAPLVGTIAAARASHAEALT
jgi:hypothetical protein